MSEDTELKFYAVRSKDGKWLRRKGYGGYGECWVDDLKSARIYTKTGGARSQVYWWFKNYPEWGCPDLVVFSTKISEVINDEERLRKTREKKEKKAGVERLQAAERQLEEAKKTVAKAQETVASLKNKI